VVEINLSEEEKELLRKYFQRSPLMLIRLKAQAITMRNNGLLISDISKAIFRNSRTIERWIKDFKDRRMASIFSGRAGNEYASKLTRIQKREIKKVLSQKPSTYGLPKEFWDIPQLKKYIYVRFDVVYESDRSYHFLLEFGDLSFKCPDKFNVRRDEKQIENRMEEIYGEILPLLEDSSWEVFCSDETRMQLEAITRKAWIRKGEKTVLKVERSKDYQNYLGFLNQRTSECHVFEIAWGKQTEIIKATAEFIKLYPNKRICIIWDNAGCHKGALIRRALSRGGVLQRVHLVNLPPYAPDHNPIEHVWNTTKEKLSNNQDKTFEETKQKFMTLTNSQIFPYSI
jgi:transposase